MSSASFSILKQTFQQIRRLADNWPGPNTESSIWLNSFANERPEFLYRRQLLMEFLTFATQDYLTEIYSSNNFEVAPFDQRAAIEAGQAIKRAKNSSSGKKLGLEAKWQKIKMDWQIAAIAKVNGAQTLYSTDSDLKTIAKKFDIETVHVADLQLPPSDAPLFDGLED